MFYFLCASFNFRLSDLIVIYFFFSSLFCEISTGTFRFCVVLSSPRQNNDKRHSAELRRPLTNERGYIVR